MMSLRSSLLPTNPNDQVDAPPATEECSICLEPIATDQRVTLRCAHAFHGQCLCSHLVHDGRCPLCRDTPNEWRRDDDSWDSFSEYSEEDNGISLCDAFRAGRRAARTDPRAKRMLDTYNKWKNESSTKNTSLKELRKKVRPLEDAFDDKMDEYVKKQRVAFDKKHEVLFAEFDEVAKAYRQAQGHKRAAKFRIAKKHGFGVRDVRDVRSD